MERNLFIVDMESGQTVEGFYILKDAYSKTTTTGKPFLSAVISDKTGTIDVKVWDYTGDIGSAQIGQVVKIRGEVSEFKGNLQISVLKIRIANSDDSYDINNLVPVAPINIDESMNKINSIIESITDEDYKLICNTMLERHIDAFKKIPAGKSVHHSFISGLLMHTTNMLCIAEFLSNIYSNVIDRGLLLTGTLLHDFAKEKEFTLSELGMVTDYSIKGQLLGHLVMGAQEISELSKELNIPEDKSVLLQHMILSHHGEPELGAAVKPVCAESELLSYIDLIDSRMEIYTEVFSDLPVGDFSKRIFALEKKIYNHGVE